MKRNQIGIYIKRYGMIVLILACLICGLGNFFKNKQSSAAKTGEWKRYISRFFKEQMEEAYFLLPDYIEDGQGTGSIAKITEKLLMGELPVFDYVLSAWEPEEITEDEITAEMIRRQEGLDEDYKDIGDEQLDYGKDAIHIESNMLAEMEKENDLHNIDANEETGRKEAEVSESIESENRKVDITIDGLGNTDASTEFVEAKYPVYSYDWSEDWNYGTLVSNFFAVDNSTLLQEEYLDLDRLLNTDVRVDPSVEGPQILIYHTHAHEAFEDSVEGDESTTIVGAGEKLANLLEEKYGFRVLHHKGVYDEEREDAYAKALPALEEILEENPTIEVVIDLHRDGMSGDRKLVMDLQGKPTARFMFFNGLSYTQKGGEISYLENPYIQENLALSFQAQVAANEYYPGIARKVYLKAYRYNMHLKPKSMLIELGAQNNTVEEIMNACDPLAHILAIVLGNVVY